MASSGPSQDHISDHSMAGWWCEPLWEPALSRRPTGHHQPWTRSLWKRHFHMCRGLRKVLPSPNLPRLPLQENGPEGEGNSTLLLHMFDYSEAQVLDWICLWPSVSSTQGGGAHALYWRCGCGAEFREEGSGPFRRGHEPTTLHTPRGSERPPRVQL